MNPTHRTFMRPLFYDRHVQPQSLPSYFLSLIRKYLPHTRAPFQAEPQPLIHASTTETPYNRALRFAENDINFARVFPLLQEMDIPERFTLAKLASEKESGITDCCNFARDILPKFHLPPEQVSSIIEALDKKTGGFVSKSFKERYGNTNDNPLPKVPRPKC